MVASHIDICLFLSSLISSLSKSSEKKMSWGEDKIFLKEQEGATTPQGHAELNCFLPTHPGPAPRQFHRSWLTNFTVSASLGVL